MKKTIALFLVAILFLSGCSPVLEGTKEGLSDASRPGDSVQRADETDPMPETGLNRFFGLNDPKLLEYVEDVVYSDLVTEFDSEDYIIENVQTAYLSKEYLEEVSYNSQRNVFFGYTLAELYEQFQGTKYVFTLGEDGETAVEPFEDYDDTYEKALTNVAIGTGVILLCVTVSVVTGGIGTAALAPVSVVFASSAKTASVFALSSGLLGGVSAGVIEGVRSRNFDEALKAAASGGSKDFMWGAIAGALVGGATKLSVIRRTSQAVSEGTEYYRGTVEIAEDLPQWRQAELRVLNETGGYEQLSYLNGKQVEFGTPGATRPDIVCKMVDHIEAIEVKRYNLENSGCLNTLEKELVREVKSRVKNLPKGATQKIVLDVFERGYSESLCNNVVKRIGDALMNIYPNIPIEVFG